MPFARDVQRHAGERPHDAAVVVGDQTLTWRALAENAARLVGGLRGLPARAGAARRTCGRDGRLVAILLENSTTFAEIFVGATQSPNVCAILDPKWPPALLDDVLRRLDPDLVVVGAGRDIHCASPLPDRLVLSVAGSGNRAASYEAWLSMQIPVDDLPIGPAEEPFLITFTSGTTSTPKAILRLRRSWTASLSAGATLFGLRPDCAALAPGPLAHGLTHYALAEQLVSGATFHGLRRFNGSAALAVLRSSCVTRLVVVPTMLDAICRAASGSGLALEAVNTIITAGAKLGRDLRVRAHKAFPRARLIEYYGASELGFVTVAMDRDTARDEGVGRAFPGVQLAIRAPDGITCEPGVAGTVMTRSPLVSNGYLWSDDEVGFRIENGWATVGDLGRIDETGALHLLGREGGMILTGGYNVFPSEIEAALLTVPGIEDAVVLGPPDAYLGQIVIALVGGPAIEQRSVSEILTGCATTLPRYKLPRRIAGIREWPLTGSGKIARSTLETWIETDDPRIFSLRT